MQIFFTEDFTFMVVLALSPSRYPCATAIWIQFELNGITDEHPDTMQTHFAGQVRKSHLAGLKLHPKKRIRKRLFDDSFNNFIGSHICAY
jgi:hypothetical protein